MAKPTNSELEYRHGAIYTVSGTSIARMDRGEKYTRPTERDANAKRLVQIWNLWPDVVALLEEIRDGGWVTEESYGLTRDILIRIREEVP